MRCSIAGALELIGDRWALLIIRDLSLGLSRYDDFRASTGIPAATLAARLRHLTASGIVERVRYQQRPPRDEYRLTPMGRDLWQVSLALREWGDRDHRVTVTATGLFDLYFFQIDKQARTLIQLATSYEDTFRKVNGEWLLSSSKSRRLSFLMDEVSEDGVRKVVGLGEQTQTAFGQSAQ